MKEITIPEAGSKLEVVIRSVKERIKATYVTVEWEGAIATFVFSKDRD